MKNFKRFLVVIWLLLFCNSTFACTFVNSNPTNPYVLLTGGRQGCFLLFCKDSSIPQDPWNRAIPEPCSKVKNYKIEKNFQLILGVPENRVEYHVSGQDDGKEVRLLMIPCTSNLNTWDLKPDLINFPPDPQVEITEQEGFAGETPILTSDGQKALQSLEIGDLVLSYDLENYEFKETLVISTANNQSLKELVKIKVGQKSISCGVDQRFYLSDQNKWVQARDLKVGDKLISRMSGPDKKPGFVTVDHVRLEKDKNCDTFSITLEKYHNFCTADGLIAHNCCYTVVAGVVVPLIWEAGAVVAGKFVGESLQIPSSLYPRKFRQDELEPALPKNKLISRQPPKIEASQRLGNFCGSNTGLAQQDQTRRNTKRVFDNLEYQYYQKNALQLTLAARAVWEPYRQMFQDMRSKVGIVAQEKRALVIKQTEELYKSLVQKAQEIARANESSLSQLLEQKNSQLEKAPTDKAEKNDDNPQVVKSGGDPEDPDDENEDEKTQKEKWKFENWKESLRRAERAWRKLVKRAHKLMEEGNKDLADRVQEAARKLRNSIDSAKTTPGRIYTTAASFATTSGLGKKLLDCLEATESFYGFSKAGPARIFRVIKTLEEWMFEVGDYVYFDLSHDLGLDHIEVFTKKGLEIVARTVLGLKDDMLGQVIGYKQDTAIRQFRTLNEWILEK